LLFYSDFLSQDILGVHAQFSKSSGVPGSYLSSQESRHMAFESESSQNHLKHFFASSQSRVMTWPSRVRVESQKVSSHWFACSSQCRA